MNIFITGINGFIGSHSANYLSGQGNFVYGSTSKPELKAQNSRVKHVYPLMLGDQVESLIFKDIETVIHCAHDFEPGAQGKNTRGTIAIAEAARKQGVKKQVFVSSLSSRSDAVTEYGKTKYEIEHYFLQNEGIVIRPGTVVGNGGIFGRIIDAMKKYPILPLPGGGRSKMYLIGISDLCMSIAKILAMEGPLEYNLYYPDKPELRRVLFHLRDILQCNVWLVPMPVGLLFLPMMGLKQLGIPLPVNIADLKGFIKSQDMIHQSDLGKVLEVIPSIELSLKESLESFNKKLL